jgi:anti-sigma B factor antagonist
MFDIRKADDGTIILSGRFDASQTGPAQALFDTVTGDATVDFSDLEYISSAGLGVLLGTHKRLSEKGGQLKLRGMKKLVRDVFRYSRLDTIFAIEEP